MAQRCPYISRNGGKPGAQMKAHSRQIRKPGLTQQEPLEFSSFLKAASRRNIAFDGWFG
jgi:hypothetical protein